MKTILNKKYEAIMELFYEKKNETFHLREISRKLSLNPNTAFKSLNDLEKEDYIQYKRQGNQKRYTMNKTLKTYSVFSFFDTERYESLPKSRKRAIKYFLHSLEQKPLITILFGSTATENFRENSDIDLFLITNSKIQTQEAEKYSESQTGIKINTFQLTFKEFQNQIKLKQDKTLLSAIKSGYPLTNHITYYKEVLSEN